MCLAEQGVIPRDSARALVAALLELHAAPSSFAPTADMATSTPIGRRSSPAHRGGGLARRRRARREALTTAYHLALCDELLDLGAALATAAETLIASLRHTDSSDARLHLSAGGAADELRPLPLSASPGRCLRDLHRLEALYARVDLCPAGSGSSNGSVTFQDRAALARAAGLSPDRFAMRATPCGRPTSRSRRWRVAVDRRGRVSIAWPRTS